MLHIHRTDVISQHNDAVEPCGMIAAIDKDNEFVTAPAEEVLAHQRFIQSKDYRFSDAIQNGLEPRRSADKVTALG